MSEDRLSERIERDYDSRGWAPEVRDLEAECEALKAERDRLAAEVERLESMRGAYEEAADAREAREDALADAEEERSELRAKRKRLEAEAGAMRSALSALVQQVEDSGLHLSSCIRTRYDTDDLPEGAECECFDPAMEEALAALSGSAGRRMLAQIKAGRALAEAVRTLMDRHVPAANTNARSNQWDAALDALVAWDRATVGEGGAK